METPAKIVRDIDRTHDATYDEDDRYRAERESYYENDGNGRIVDHQIETIDDRHRASATESDRERGHETIINRYDDEDGRRGSRGSRGNRDNGGITVVVNNNIPIENKVNVDVKAENKNENKNDTKQENNNKVTSTIMIIMLLCTSLFHNSVYAESMIDVPNNSMILDEEYATSMLINVIETNDIDKIKISAEKIIKLFPDNEVARIALLSLNDSNITYVENYLKNIQMTYTDNMFTCD